VQHDVERLRNGQWESAPDCLAVEEPLEIRVSSVGGRRRAEEPITVTMRTPGHDFDLAAGFLFSEGVVSETADIEDITFAEAPLEAEQGNAVLVKLRAGLAFDLEQQKRNFMMTSACGVCGKASLDALVLAGCRPLHSTATIGSETILAMPGALREAQRGFEATGGVHAAGLFKRDGELVALAEDVGRHNALDKLIGGKFLAGRVTELEDMAVLLSGRASYELLQKALRARISIVASVGAPSSLAVDIAKTFDITLAGFVRPGGFNVYSGRGRIRA